jgi:hypothetical protein
MHGHWVFGNINMTFVFFFFNRKSKLIIHFYGSVLQPPYCLQLFVPHLVFGCNNFSSKSIALRWVLSFFLFFQGLPHAIHPLNLLSFHVLYRNRPKYIVWLIVRTCRPFVLSSSPYLYHLQWRYNQAQAVKSFLFLSSVLGSLCGKHTLLSPRNILFLHQQAPDDFWLSSQHQLSNALPGTSERSFYSRNWYSLQELYCIPFLLHILDHLF